MSPSRLQIFFLVSFLLLTSMAINGQLFSAHLQLDKNRKHLGERWGKRPREQPERISAQDQVKMTGRILKFMAPFEEDDAA